MIVDIKFSVTTSAGGAVTATSTQLAIGKLINIDYDFSDLDATADITLSYTGGAGVSRNLIVFTNSQANASSSVLTDGLDAAASASGTDFEAFVGGRLKLVVAQGGNVKTATFVAYIEV